jgi:hypothetical protein
MSEPEEKSLFGSKLFGGFVFLCLFGLVILISIPNYIGPRRSGPAWNANCCINNLRQIDAAANQFALEHQLTNGDRINFPNDLTPYIKLNSAGKIPGCPAGGTYHITKVGEIPTCSLDKTVTPAHALPQ